MADVIRVPPFYFLHVLDANKGITRVEKGPKTYVREDHEKIILGPEPMIIIPPRHYCVVANPIVRKDGAIVTDDFGQAKLQHGDTEIRFSQDPFPLYPGEQLAQKVSPLLVLPPNRALQLRALRDFTDADAKKRVAGDEWLIEGPCTYVPRVEVEVVQTVNAIILAPGQALWLRAKREFVDRQSKNRKAGEEWLWTTEGSYIPEVDEEVVKTVKSIILTDKLAVHVSAKKTFVDVFGKERKAGSEWLVTNKEIASYTPGVYETVVGEVSVTTLSKQQYCVVVDPIDQYTGEPQLGKRELRKGEASFFLRPGESLPGGVRKVHVLGEEDGVLVRALLAFDDKRPGDKWMVMGPCEYVPPVEVDIIETRKVIPLDENEGIYVRDTQSGKIRAVIGESYMLKPFEELWTKELAPAVESLLSRDFDPLADRNSSGTAAKPLVREKYSVVTYRVPHNAAVQVYDYKEKQSRIVFGPELVLLGPDEQFTLLNLSGGRPKKEKAIKSLVLLLGPDFMTDMITVETADHARLSLTLAYNWRFDVDKKDPESAARLFAVPDFVGTACKAIASRVRGSVAQIPFDEFHRESAGLIRSAVFGKSDVLSFPTNNLVITSVDIQSVEPVDQKTRDSLMKSVQLAIEITTTSQEATARHEAERREQEAKGKLERQKIMDEAAAEEERANLLLLQAQSAAIESTGHSKAEARARAEAGVIQGQSAVELARLKAEASKIQADAELSQTQTAQKAELEYARELDSLTIAKAEKLAAIESNKFKSMVKTIGPETIKSIARAGPEMQAKLLSGLGVQSLLITDGNNPINLFNTANGLVGINGNGTA